ncbi:MAG: PEP-CTERM sorting domain-containing protein [Phycisphaerae bacterium]
MDIPHAVLYLERGSVDDLHFGIIPEPGTLLLLLIGVGFGRGVRQHCILGGARGTICLCGLALVASRAPGRADIPVSGHQPTIETGHYFSVTSV